MSKLARKFLVSISILIILVVLFTLFVNANFIQRFYVYQKKIELKEIADKFIWDELSYEEITEIEDENGIIVVETMNRSDIDFLNKELYDAFLRKGMGLQKYWLWEGDYESTIKNGSQMRIYSQGKLNYSVMVQYLMSGNRFIGVAVIIPNMEQTIGMVNQLTIIIFTIAILILIVLLYRLVKRITKPIEELGVFAVGISNQNFGEITLNTGDELEDLAGHLNEMSKRLAQSQQDLKYKNEQMQQFLGHVSHDLKTPIALIKLYANAMKDGMDDGSFLDTIICQNANIEQMTERLLTLTGIQHQKPPIESVDLTELLNRAINDYSILNGKENLTILTQIEENAIIDGNESSIHSIFDNLLSNSIKYAAGKTIDVILTKEKNFYYFSISNEIEETANIDETKIFEPFYVGEKSRNKELSGTGLGLSIVQAIADSFGYRYECRIENQKFCISIYFHNAA